MMKYNWHGLVFSLAAKNEKKPPPLLSEFPLSQYFTSTEPSQECKARLDALKNSNS